MKDVAALILVYGIPITGCVLLIREIWRAEKRRTRRERFQEWESKLFAAEKEKAERERLEREFFESENSS